MCLMRFDFFGITNHVIILYFLNFSFLRFSKKEEAGDKKIEATPHKESVKKHAQKKR